VPVVPGPDLVALSPGGGPHRRPLRPRDGVRPPDRRGGGDLGRGGVRLLRHFDASRLGLSIANPNGEALVGSLSGLAAGAGLVWAVAVAGKFAFKKEAMGFGDVKFMGMIGGFLGPLPVVMVFFIGCFFGSFVGVALYVVTRNRYMPFGPYLALGAAIMLLFGEEAFWVATDWWPRLVRGEW